MRTPNSTQSSLALRTDGSSSTEMLVLVLTVALAGAGGMQLLGGGMGNAIAGEAGSGQGMGRMATAAMAGEAGSGGSTTTTSIAVAAQAGAIQIHTDADGNILEFTDEALAERGIKQEDLELLQSISVDVEHLDAYTREDLEALGVDAEIIDKLYGLDPNSVAPMVPATPTGNGSGNGTGNPNGGPSGNLPTAPTLNDGKQVTGSLDPNEINADELLQGTGEGLTIGEIDPEASKFTECSGKATLEERAACNASVGGVDLPESYTPGGSGCFSAGFGGCLKDKWHEFAGAFEKHLGGIGSFFKGFIDDPGQAFASLGFSISHPDVAFKSTVDYYKEQCVNASGLNCAGTIAADGAFALISGGVGRVLHAGKMSIIKRFPEVGELPGFRLAGRRMESGPFTSKKFKEVAMELNAPGGAEGIWWQRRGNTMSARRVFPSRTFGGSTRAAWESASMFKGEARLFAETIRRGRATGFTSLIGNTDIAGLGVRNVAEMSSEVLTRLSKTVDDAVSARGYTAADKVLREVAENADGTASLSDKLISIEADKAGRVEMVIKGDERITGIAGANKNKNVQFKVEGDNVRITLPNEYTKPRLPSWHATKYLDSIGMGIPIAAVGGVASHGDKAYRFLQAVKAQQETAGQ